MRAPAIIVEAVGVRFEDSVLAKRSLRFRVICSSTLRKGRYLFVCRGAVRPLSPALFSPPISVSPSSSRVFARDRPFPSSAFVFVG